MGNPAVDAQRHKGRSLRSGAIPPPRTGGFTNYPPITTVFPNLVGAHPCVRPPITAGLPQYAQRPLRVAPAACGMGSV